MTNEYYLVLEHSVTMWGPPIPINYLKIEAKNLKKYDKRNSEA